MNPLEIVRAFVGAINSGNIGDLSRLMTPDHVFIDSDGSEVRGHEQILAAWQKYLTMVPDYRIEVKETFRQSNTVVLIGTAAGTFSQDGTLDPQNSWRVPATWRAITADGRVAVWQLFVDPEPMRQIAKRLGRT